MNKKNYLAKLRTLVAAASLFVLCAMPEAYARQGLGVGGIVGEPTGLSLKYWLTDTSAIDAAFGIAFSDNNNSEFHADYLMHSASSRARSASISWYYGIGGRIKNDNDTRVGIRAPLGLTYLFADTPIDLFGEIVPVLDLSPKGDLGLNGAAGLRYYFH